LAGPVSLGVVVLFNLEGPRMGHTHQSIEIEVPADVVWNTIRNFYDMSWAPNVIQNTRAVGDVNGGKVGAQRLLNGQFSETLIELNDDSRIMRYSIDDGPSPVSKAEIDNYAGCIEVKPSPSGNGALVEWSSGWEKNEEQVREFCQNIYVALLNDMKQSLESAYSAGD
jgi:hypothetical protein